MSPFYRSQRLQYYQAFTKVFDIKRNLCLCGRRQTKTQCLLALLRSASLTFCRFQLALDQFQTLQARAVSFSLSMCHAFGEWGGSMGEEMVQ